MQTFVCALALVPRAVGRSIWPVFRSAAFANTAKVTAKRRKVSDFSNRLWDTFSVWREKKGGGAHGMEEAVPRTTELVDNVFEQISADGQGACKESMCVR